MLSFASLCTVYSCTLQLVLQAAGETTECTLPKIEIAEIIEVDGNEETVDIEEELDDIEKKFDETKGPKLKYQ